MLYSFLNGSVKRFCPYADKNITLTCGVKGNEEHFGCIEMSRCKNKGKCKFVSNDNPLSHRHNVIAYE